MELYYIACWVQGDKVVRCGHQHGTIAEAEKCRTEIVGRFFRAVDTEGERSLNDEEFEVAKERGISWRELEKVLS